MKMILVAQTGQQVCCLTTLKKSDEIVMETNTSEKNIGIIAVFVLFMGGSAAPLLETNRIFFPTIQKHQSE